MCNSQKQNILKITKIATSIILIFCTHEYEDLILSFAFQSINNKKCSWKKKDINVKNDFPIKALSDIVLDNNSGWLWMMCWIYSEKNKCFLLYVHLSEQYTRYNAWQNKWIDYVSNSVMCFSLLKVILRNQYIKNK